MRRNYHRRKAIADKSLLWHQLYRGLKGLSAYSYWMRKNIRDQIAFQCYLKGRPVPRRIDALFDEIAAGCPSFKFNPYHDELGRFTFAPGGPADDSNDDDTSSDGNGATIDQIDLYLQADFGIRANAADIEEEEDVEKPEEEVSPSAEVGDAIYDAAASRLREIDPNNPELHALDSDASATPEDIYRINQVIDQVKNAQVSNRLAPGGVPIGSPGSDPTIRELPGGASAAENLFNELITGLTPDTETDYRGTAYRLPNGGFIGYRTMSKSGPPAIDIHIDPLEDVIDQLKFPSD